MTYIYIYFSVAKQAASAGFQTSVIRREESNDGDATDFSVVASFTELTKPEVEPESKKTDTKESNGASAEQNNGSEKTDEPTETTAPQEETPAK